MEPDSVMGDWGGSRNVFFLFFFIRIYVKVGGGQRDDGQRLLFAW